MAKPKGITGDELAEWKARQKAYFAERYRAKREEIRARQAAFYAANADRIRAAVNGYRIANSGVIKERKRASYEANKRDILPKMAEYRRRNLEKVRARIRAYKAAHRAELSAKQKAYAAAHPDVPADIRRRYRARKLKAGGAHTTKEWCDLLSSFSGKCVYCGSDARHADHVVPLSRGGSDRIENIVPACGSCNASKRASMPSEWIWRRAKEGRIPPRLLE